MFKNSFSVFFFSALGKLKNEEVNEAVRKSKWSTKDKLEILSGKFEVMQ